jgi:hypothetical protein
VVGRDERANGEAASGWTSWIAAEVSSGRKGVRATKKRTVVYNAFLGMHNTFAVRLRPKPLKIQASRCP